MDEPKINKKMEKEIETLLKRVYDETLKEEVPERFLSLIDKLKKQENAK